MKHTGYAFFAFIFLAFGGCRFATQEVDLIVHNAVVFTADPQNPKVEAFAVKDGQIVEMGPERHILNRYRAAKKYDARKQYVYPGFIDAHCHFLGYGLNKAQADLSELNSPDELVERLRQHRAAYPDAAWLLGRGWDQNRFDPPVYPTCDLLDAAFPDVPVYIVRVDGHAAIANTKAIELAGIDAQNPPVIPGGELLTDDGRLTGVLIDNAMEVVREHIPPASLQEKTRALSEAQRDCFGYGLTSIGDAGLSTPEIMLIDSLQQAGDLKMQVYAMVSSQPEYLEEWLARGPYLTERLNVRSFKFYADGALGSRGACLLEPYSDRMDTRHRGFLLNELDEMREWAYRIQEAGFQMNTHCIGDSANRAVLNLYAEVLESANDRRWRIEHAQVVHKDDLPMFGFYTVIPSVQPVHATSDMYWAELRLGRNRIRRAYAYKELLEQNGMLALGTDFPVEGIQPLATFYAATVRKDAKGWPDGGFQIENAITREQALLGMTLWAAIAQFEEERKGSISVGKQADFVVLDRDLLTCGDDDILSASVQSTWVMGEEVYTKP